MFVWYEKRNESKKLSSSVNLSGQEKIILIFSSIKRFGLFSFLNQCLSLQN